VRLFHLKLFKCPTTNNQDKKKKAQDRNVIHFIFPASPSKEISNHPRVAILVAILYIDDEYSILVTVYQIKNQPAGKRNGEINSMDAFNRGRQHTHTHIRDRTPFFLLLCRYTYISHLWTAAERLVTLDPLCLYTVASVGRSPIKYWHVTFRERQLEKISNFFFFFFYWFRLRNVWCSRGTKLFRWEDMLYIGWLERYFHDIMPID
jgi:hypothetical protein